jgi:hypothetical protein
MKEKDILTDFKAHQVVLYAEKGDNSIGPVQTGSYVSRHYIDEFYYYMDKVENAILEKLRNNEISPIRLYMEIEDLTMSELAARVQLSKRKVKKHLLPEHFMNIRISELMRYADVFNIPVANFFQIISTRQDHEWRPGYKEDIENAKPVVISQQKTMNPFIVVTKAESNQL